MQSQMLQAMGGTPTAGQIEFGGMMTAGGPSGALVAGMAGAMVPTAGGPSSTG